MNKEKINRLTKQKQYLFKIIGKKRIAETQLAIIYGLLHTKGWLKGKELLKAINRKLPRNIRTDKQMPRFKSQITNLKRLAKPLETAEIIEKKKRELKDHRNRPYQAWMYRLKPNIKTYNALVNILSIASDMGIKPKDKKKYWIPKLETTPFIVELGIQLNLLPKLKKNKEEHKLMEKRGKLFEAEIQKVIILEQRKSAAAFLEQSEKELQELNKKLTEESKD